MGPIKENNFGKTVKKKEGTQVYYAYYPHKLIPDGPRGIEYNSELMVLLSEADRVLGELNGITKTLKNPDLFVAFYVRKEALLSSQIEGTQCSLDDIFKTDEKDASKIDSVGEVVNYIRAMNIGLEKLKKLPFSIRLMKDIHSILLEGVRGKGKAPGEFKKSQNWIASEGRGLFEADFVPLPHFETAEWMGDLEKYYHQREKFPFLIKAAVIHLYFETIHPFLDGNGRLGRLLITFLLCEKNILDRPLLYLSLFFKEYRDDYYNLLMKVRLTGNWNEWIVFFLRGVRNTSLQAIATAQELIQLNRLQKKIIHEKLKKLSYAPSIYDILCEYPIITISKIAKTHNIPYPTVKRTINALEEHEIVQLKGGVVSMEKYLAILRRGTD